MVLSQKTKGIISICSSGLLYLVLGSTYIWGNINIYVSSYYGSISSDLGSVIFPISGLISNLGMLLSFLVVDKLGFRKTIIFSSLLMFGFILACAFCPNFWLFFCCFGIGFGLAVGFPYLTLMYNCYKYFPSRRGLIGGILMGFYGLAALISNYIILMMINPENISPAKDSDGDYHFPQEIADKLPSAMKYLSFYFLGISILSNLFQFEFQEPAEIETQYNEEDLGLEKIIEVKEESLLESNTRSVLLNKQGSKIKVKSNLNDSFAPLKDQEIVKDKESAKDKDDFFLKSSERTSKEIPKDEKDTTINNASGCTNMEPTTTNTNNNDNEIFVEENAVNSDHNTEKKEKNMGKQKKKPKKIKKSQWSISSIDSHDETRCFSLKDAAKTKAFYLIFGMMYLTIANGYFMATNFKGYGITKINDDQFLTLVGSLSSLCNGGGRLFWGLISDKFAFKKVYGTILVIQMIEIITIRFISHYRIAYLLWVCVALLCEGGHFVTFPPLCLQVFGPEVGSKVYGFLLLICAAANLTQFGLNLGLRPLIGYDNEFYIYFGFTVFAFVLLMKNEIKFRR